MSASVLDWNAELEEAVSGQDLARARAALEQAADPNRRWGAGSSFAGTTLLTDAVGAGSEEMVDLLIAHGAMVAAEVPEDGSTSLHAAVEDGQTAILRRLLKTDVGPHLGTYDYIERTPLHIAAERGDLDAARLLLAAGADVNARNEDRAGDSALADAVREGHADMVALLVQAGADPLAKGWMGLTPLDRATGTRNPERVRIREMLGAAVAACAANSLFECDAGHPLRAR
jgi:ankyrin repeat protein